MCELRMEGCDHDFLYIESIYDCRGTGSYKQKYVRIDRFYCRKCLLGTEKRKEEDSHGMPEWYKP